MPATFDLYVIDPDAKRANSLKLELAPLSQITVVENYQDAVERSGGLDAFFMSLMSAIEWGCIPIPAPVYQTSVVKVPEFEITAGRPHYGIPGVAINPGDFLEPVACTRLVLRESFRAIDVFNRTSACPLQKICAVSSQLGLNELKQREAFVLLSEAYSLSFAEPDSDNGR